MVHKIEFKESVIYIDLPNGDQYRLNTIPSIKAL
jgi:hypothetical protein